MPKHDDVYVKYLSELVFSRELEEVVEIYVEEGWELVDTVKVRGFRDRYKLTFKYEELNDELTIEEENPEIDRKKQFLKQSGCIYRLVAIFWISMIVLNHFSHNSSQKNNQDVRSESIAQSQQERTLELRESPIPYIYQTPSATITDASRPTRTPRPIVTPRPTQTPRVTRQPATSTMYVSADGNRARSCPALNNSRCPVRFTFDMGDEVEVIQRVTGDEYLDSTSWWEISHRGQTVYMHTSLLTRTPISMSAPSGQSGGASSSGSSGSSSGSGASAPPVEQPGTSWNCSGDVYNCNSFSTCSEMSDYFQTCPGDPSRLDRDGDGVPCETGC